MAAATTATTPPAEAPGRPTPESDHGVLFTLARALHQAGLPSHRLESMLGRVAARMGWSVEAFALPTGLLVSAWRGDEPPTIRLFRLMPRPTHLERLRLLTLEGEALAAGRVGPRDALARIDAIQAETRTAPPLLTGLGMALSAAGFSVVFGGGGRELLVSMLVGLVVGAVAVAFGSQRGASRRFELVASFAAGLIATLIDQHLSHFVHWIPIASGLVVCLPGLALVDAIEELASGHLASGGARMAGVGVTFLALIFGSILGVNLAGLAGDLTPEVGPIVFPAWALAPSLAVIALGSVFRFHARPRDWPIILVASAVALVGSRLGGRLGNPLLGPFVGSMALGLAATAYARFWRPTPQLMLVPGLALLVPGSLGMRSLGALVEGDSVRGIEQGFTMFMMGMALVAGLLLSNPLAREPGRPG